MSRFSHCEDGRRSIFDIVVVSFPLIWMARMSRMEEETTLARSINPSSNTMRRRQQTTNDNTGNIFTVETPSFFHHGGP
jgi:hypothetical protein